jgi:transcriptional regulator with XRE-family HTH domain
MSQVNFGKCFKAAQKNRGISNRQVMNDFGVFRQQVHRWQNTPSITLHKAEEFANYFGYTLIGFLKLGQEDDTKKDN